MPQALRIRRWVGCFNLLLCDLRASVSKRRIFNTEVTEKTQRTRRRIEVIARRLSEVFDAQLRVRFLPSLFKLAQNHLSGGRFSLPLQALGEAE